MSRASAAFKAGAVDVKAGDYIVRGDQPFRTLADMYFSIQNYRAAESVAVRRHRAGRSSCMRDIRIVAGQRARRSSISR